MWFFTWEVSADYYPRSPGIVSLLMLTIVYIQAVILQIQTQGRFNDHTAHSLYRIMVTATSVMGMMKLGNIVPRGGIEPTYLSLWASVLTITPLGFLIPTSYPRLLVYAVLCLRGQYRLLHIYLNIRLGSDKYQF